MRMMLRINIDALNGSKALKDGSLQKAIMGFSEKYKPEASYFTDHEGLRTGIFVFDMKGSEYMVDVAERFFDTGCKAVISSCMSPADLQAGFALAGL